jgi:hypothetical protein
MLVNNLRRVIFIYVFNLIKILYGNRNKDYACHRIGDTPKIILDRHTQKHLRSRTKTYTFVTEFVR